MRDPRIVDMTPDKVWAILAVRDVPSHVYRTGSFTYGGTDRTLAEAIQCIFKRINRGADSRPWRGRAGAVNLDAVCGVKASDLVGWDLGIVNGTFSTVTPVQRPTRVLKDWPLTCPRCNRAESAIQLFTSVECRHGCFARGAS